MTITAYTIDEVVDVLSTLHLLSLLLARFRRAPVKAAVTSP